MTAQGRWKQIYHEMKSDMYFEKYDDLMSKRNTLTYPAALERKLEAAQRTIEAQAERIEELEIDVDMLQAEVMNLDSVFVEVAE